MSIRANFQPSLFVPHNSNNISIFYTIDVVLVIGYNNILHPPSLPSTTPHTSDTPPHYHRKQPRRKMLKSFVSLLSVFAVSSARFAYATGHVHVEEMVIQPTSIQDRDLGRKKNLRNGGSMKRNLIFSMSMSFPLEGVEVPVFAPEATYYPNSEAENSVLLLDAAAPTGCTSDDECPVGSSCKCWLSCRFCIAQFSPCGVCEEL